MVATGLMAQPGARCRHARADQRRARAAWQATALNGAGADRPEAASIRKWRLSIAPSPTAFARAFATAARPTAGAA
jgi:hypothetical protein